MTQLVTANLVVAFTSAAADGSATLSAEVDSRPTGLNSGNTSFIVGDSPGIILYYTDGVVIDYIQTSEGYMVYQGVADIKQTEDLTFAKSREAGLSKPCSNSFSVKAQTPGTPGIVLFGQGKVVTADRSIILGAYHVTYNATGHLYRVVGASGIVPVVVYIAGHYL